MLFGYLFFGALGLVFFYHDWRSHLKHMSSASPS